MTEQNELEEIKKFMSIIQETLDVTYYGLEGDSINIQYRKFCFYRVDSFVIFNCKYKLFSNYNCNICKVSNKIN